MAIKEPTCRWGLLLPLLGLIPWAQRGLTQGCVCPGATVVTRLPAEIPGDACCLNYSGSALDRLSWPAFGIINNNNNNYNNNNNISRRGVEILDLSHCNITHIELRFAGAATHLKEVHLHHNRLVMLPEDFLARHPSLRVLDLGWNQLLEVPEGLLQGSEDLRRLDLGGNRLRSLEPVSSVLRMPRLRSLELDHNPWDCSCGLVELLAVATATGVNGTSVFSSGPAGNLTCASPRKLEGVAVRSLTPAAVCQPPGLTALFILLPLLLLAGLLLCWCCGRKRKRRKDATFDSKKRKSKQHQKTAAGRDPPPRKKAPPVAHGDPALDPGGAPAAGSPERGGGILKDRLLLRPASPLRSSSTRDTYEEVEAGAKLGSSSSFRDSRTSVTSTEEGGSGLVGLPGNTMAAGGGGGGDGEGGGRRAELDDVVSVSEVLKDSANREKAYLVQSTEYYSLLPGMDLGDSDHGEYESVDLT